MGLSFVWFRQQKREAKEGWHSIHFLVTVVERKKSKDLRGRRALISQSSFSYSRSVAGAFLCPGLTLFMISVGPRSFVGSLSGGASCLSCFGLGC
jgi:hypothetical protein